MSDREKAIIETLREGNRELRAAIERLRSVLAWYADEKNYLRGAPGEYTPREFITPMWLCDMGERARKALKGGE